MRSVRENRQILSKNKSEERNIYLMLLPMLLGICLCTVCLVGGTFAWFSASQTTSTQSIVSSNYSVNTTVVALDGAAVDTQNGSIYTLEAGKTYNVTLQASGSATTGYCIVKLNDDFFCHTVQFPSNENTTGSISFSLKMNESADLSIEAQWGSSAWDEEKKIKNNETYSYGEQKTVELTPTPADENTDVGSAETEPIINVTAEVTTEPKATEKEAVPDEGVENSGESQETENNNK